MTTNPDPAELLMSDEEYALLCRVQDEDLERAADMHEPTNVSAPSKAMHHCVND